MHPIDKKNKRYSVVILVLALIISVFCIINNSYYAIVTGIFAIYSITFRIEVVPKIVLVGILTIVAFPSIYLIEYLFNQGAIPSNSPIELGSAMSIGYTSLVLLFPLFVLSLYFLQIVKTAKNQKDHYEVIDKHPYIICNEHYTRTKKYKSFTYKGVKCRVGKKCLIHSNIQKAVHLVGLIGLIEDGKTVDNDYYITLWDHRYRKIRYGDYDIIEIHENNEVKDYDFIIAKVITFFSNEINRYKPFNEVLVKVIGNPPISENTKRLLEKHFMSLEYVVPELGEVYA
jgi:hypothetical protein